MTSLRNALTGFRALLHFDNRWQLVVSRALFPRTSLLVYKTGDLEILVDHAAGDHNGTRLCLISDIYARFLPLMDLGQSISVLDLGANGGGFPLLLHLQGKKFSRLVCVEMNPNTFSRLQYNTSRNLSGDVRLVEAAVCGSRRQLPLLFGRGDISDTIYQDDPDSLPKSSRQFDVAGRTLDDLFHSHFGQATIDICKMDIEGAEYEVLDSEEQKSLRLCRYLLVELHATARGQHERFVGRLSDLGFTQVKTGAERIPGEWLFRNECLAKSDRA